MITLINYKNGSVADLNEKLAQIKKGKSVVELNQVSSARFPENHIVQNSDIVTIKTNEASVGLFNFLSMQDVFIAKNHKRKMPDVVIITEELLPEDFEPISMRYICVNDGRKVVNLKKPTNRLKIDFTKFENINSQL